jgi:hypothetical protein
MSKSEKGPTGRNTGVQSPLPGATASRRFPTYVHISAKWNGLTATVGRV